MASRRRFLASAGASTAVFGGLCVGRTRADDFGKLLEKAASKALDGGANGLRKAAESALEGRSRSAPEPFAVKTADGWNLVALRHRPTGPSQPGAPPIILCHGLTYNASFWDLLPNCSLAKHLSAAGYDVWAVNLRGCGLSQKWVWKLDDAPEMLVGSAVRRVMGDKSGAGGFPSLDPKYANWTLDDHIQYDVPALIRLVKRHTKAPGVAWIGHSMGGIVAICHLTRNANPGIDRLATIGSQVTMPNGQLMVQFASEMLQVRASQLSGKLTGEQLMTDGRVSVHNMFFNQANVDPKVYAALGGPATDVPAIDLMKQYNVLGTKGELWDSRGKFNYAHPKALANVQAPMLISCGAGDQFAPPAVQKYLFDHVGAAEKSLLVFGRSRGFSVDAGHNDALVGLNSRAQVYPVIERWLRGEKV